MNNKIIEYINELKYIVLKGNSLDALQKIEDIEKILGNSVIIPKDELRFEFKKIEANSFDFLGRIVCQISGPKLALTYDKTSKLIKENEEEFMYHLKEEMKKNLIDRWSMSEDE